MKKFTTTEIFNYLTESNHIIGLNGKENSLPGFEGTICYYLNISKDGELKDEPTDEIIYLYEENLEDTRNDFDSEEDFENWIHSEFEKEDNEDFADDVITLTKRANLYIDYIELIKAGKVNRTSAELINEAEKIGVDRDNALKDLDWTIEELVGCENRKDLVNEYLPDSFYNDFIFGCKCQLEDC